LCFRRARRKRSTKKVTRPEKGRKGAREGLDSKVKRKKIPFLSARKGDCTPAIGGKIGGGRNYAQKKGTPQGKKEPPA